ncbi:immunoglobulin-binding protein 1 [Spea bombifrons]|uniref:immunoglobulin-binding protein 1 n=1 Tax=Spea bombifrons TaxID=233779 RepID=UPI00234B58FB|nr:immunoglobulin-binding protein 1 [Spea bombifrons]
MAESSEPEFPKLAHFLENGWQLLKEVEGSSEPSASRELQDKVKKGLGLLEQAVRMVTQLDLFSRNEELDEISSADIRYLLLPALQGALTLKQVGLTQRLQHLETARSYFMDFLQRCHDYKVSKFELPQQQSHSNSEEQKMTHSMSPAVNPNLTAMALQRQAKIERYNQKKELESRLASLQESVRVGTAEEEQVREYYLLQLRQWVHTALEEIESIDQELPLVRAREAMKKGADVNPPPRVARPPMKPFILTRDAVQAKVFGAGYPSLPTMTVDDWYEQHRKKGMLPDQGVFSKPTDEEQELADRERKEETDDPETLQKARNWDDWKDDHRRGYGNRKNMG